MASDTKKKKKPKKEAGEDVAYMGMLVDKLIACGLAFMFMWWLGSMAWNAITTSWPW